MIREEFEKAFEQWLFREACRSDRQITPPIEMALWAAKWMAERCALYCNDHFGHDGTSSADLIRQLAKELEP